MQSEKVKTSSKRWVLRLHFELVVFCLKYLLRKRITIQRVFFICYSFGLEVFGQFVCEPAMKNRLFLAKNAAKFILLHNSEKIMAQSSPHLYLSSFIWNNKRSTNYFGVWEAAVIKHLLKSCMFSLNIIP